MEEIFSDFATAQKAVAIACSTYNYLRPHGSIDNMKPAEAHQKTGPIKKRWKNYYQKKESEVMKACERLVEIDYLQTNPNKNKIMYKRKN